MAVASVLRSSPLELTALDHTFVPYFTVKWFYDTSYDGCARALYGLGPEVTVNPSGSPGSAHRYRERITRASPLLLVKRALR